MGLLRPSRMSFTSMRRSSFCMRLLVAVPKQKQLCCLPSTNSSTTRSRSRCGRCEGVGIARGLPFGCEAHNLSIGMVLLHRERCLVVRGSGCQPLLQDIMPSSSTAFIFSGVVLAITTIYGHSTLASSSCDYHLWSCLYTTIYGYFNATFISARSMTINASASVYSVHRLLSSPTSSLVYSLLNSISIILKSYLRSSLIHHGQRKC